MPDKEKKHNQFWLIIDEDGNHDLAYIDEEDGTYNSTISRECMDLYTIKEYVREIPVPELN